MCIRFFASDYKIPASDGPNDMLSKIHTHKQTIHMQSVNKGCISISRFSQKSMPSSVRFLPRSSDNLNLLSYSVKTNVS